MAYTLNSINLSVYGITPGHCTGSNIAVQGCYSMPERDGLTYHSWGDESGIEPFVAVGEIFFKGRDITFTGSIRGSRAVIKSYLDALYTAIDLFSDLVVLSTPYGDFSVYVKTVIPDMLNGGAGIVITFREPVVTLTGGTLPATGTNAYTIDSRPLSSFGLYLTKPYKWFELPDTKEQLFTKYGTEGLQITKRQHKMFEFRGFVAGTSLVDFQDKIKALYLLFSSVGLRTMVVDGITVSCFATEGFTVSNVFLYNNGVIANINFNLIIA
jgi:hypothetical protein